MNRIGNNIRSFVFGSMLLTFAWAEHSYGYHELGNIVRFWLWFVGILEVLVFLTAPFATAKSRTKLARFTLTFWIMYVALLISIVSFGWLATAVVSIIGTLAFAVVVEAELEHRKDTNHARM